MRLPLRDRSENMKLHVAIGRSIRHGQLMLHQGEEVVEGVIPVERIRHLLTRGFLVEVPDSPKPPKGVKAPKPPKEEKPKDGRPVLVSPTPWTFTDEQLEGQSLDQLNALIVERDQSVPLFETVEEARAFLTQHAE